MAQVERIAYEQGDLAKRIRASRSSAQIVTTILQTDDRVIARVTDGIYRQPGSALRELISNAYDADATQVVIKTDAPRFEKVIVEDDGHGMSPDALAYLLHHIGGSAKRSDVGAGIGVTAEDDPFKSPGGRRLIGKIGIGLFSVSQLTRSFQIVTKVAGDDFRTVATVSMKQYSDEVHYDADKFESGKINIWREPATDNAAHGTTIILNGIHTQTRETLRSQATWDAIDQAQEDTEERSTLEPPRYHIGRVQSDAQHLLKAVSTKYENLPWDASDSPDAAFKKLVDSVWSELGRVVNPKLEDIFDYYLQMVWQLALAVPVKYVDGALFDHTADHFSGVYQLANTKHGSAERVEVPQGQTIRTALGLTEPAEQRAEFRVFVDDLELLRPIRYTNLPTSNHAVTRPLVFIGSCSQEFEQSPKALSGGALKFEAYLIWTPKVAPTEHRGSLIRVHGASGTMFDATFMKYQIAEYTRLGQITCEFFVIEGLESALNIDRESLNFAHPHVVFLTRWLHSALRQLATTHKKVAKDIREGSRDADADNTKAAMDEIVASVWKTHAKDPTQEVPEVLIDSGTAVLTPQSAKPTEAELTLPTKAASRPVVVKREVFSPAQQRVNTAKEKARRTSVDNKVKAIVQLLVAFEVYDIIPEARRNDFLNSIYRILDVSED